MKTGMRKMLSESQLWEKTHFSKKMSFFCQKKFPRYFIFGCFFATYKMWVLKSLSKVVVAEPFKSEAEMARKLGVSQQYVNRQLRKYNFLFHLDGKKVVAHRAPAFMAGTKKIYMKEDMGQILGVPQEAIEKVFRKKTSGFVQTPQGEVKIQRLKPGEKPILPAVRVLWNDDTEKQDFFSFAAAAKELKIDPKTIPHALRAGRDSFTRKSDGKKFTIKIPGEKTRLKPKPLSEEEKAKREEAKRRRMIAEEYMTRCHKISSDQTPFEEMERVVESMRARDEERERKKNHQQIR